MVVGINRRNDRSDCDIQYPYRSDTRQSSEFTLHLLDWINNHCASPCLSEQVERSTSLVRSAIKFVHVPSPFNLVASHLCSVVNNWPIGRRKLNFVSMGCFNLEVRGWVDKENIHCLYCSCLALDKVKSNNICCRFFALFMFCSSGLNFEVGCIIFGLLWWKRMTNWETEKLQENLIWACCVHYHFLFAADW
jgi:hypothetical protein